MAFNLTSTTALSIGVLVNKVFTFTKDLISDGRSVRYLLSSMSGTGGITDVHSVDVARSVTFQRPDVYRRPGKFNTTSGRYDHVPRNLFVIKGQFGMKVSASQVEVAPFRIEMPIPAGAVAYDASQIESYVAMMLGAVYSQATAIVAAIKTGEM